MRMNRPTHTYEFTKTSDEFTNSYGSLRAFMRLGVEHSLNGTIISFDGEVKTKEDVPDPPPQRHSVRTMYGEALS